MRNNIIETSDTLAGLGITPPKSVKVLEAKTKFGTSEVYKGYSKSSKWMKNIF